MDFVKELIEGIFLGIINTTPIEYVAVFFGVLSVYFSKQEKIAVFPTGIISTTLYIYLAWSGGLYAESGINCYYTLMSIYGWHRWLGAKKKGANTTLHISALNLKSWSIMIMLGIAFWLFLNLVLSNMTDSTVPVIDSLSTATAFVAMYLMASKKIEHWWWWIATDVISIPLYYYKGYVFTCLQFIIFLAIAIAGLKSWSKKMRLQNASTLG